MCSSLLKTIKGTHHTTSLNEETRLIHHQLYHAGHRSREMLCERIYKLLETGVADPAHFKWRVSLH